MGSII